MTVKTRPLNQGEKFCCSMKKVKELFADTDVTLDFGYLGREYVTFGHTKDAYYMENHVKGKVLMSFYMTENYPEPIIVFMLFAKSMRFPMNCRQRRNKCICRNLSDYIPKSEKFPVQFRFKRGQPRSCCWSFSTGNSSCMNIECEKPAIAFSAMDGFHYPLNWLL